MWPGVCGEVEVVRDVVGVKGFIGGVGMWRC